jgi:hypothetical protein
VDIRYEIGGGLQAVSGFTQVVRQPTAKAYTWRGRTGRGDVCEASGVGFPLPIVDARSSDQRQRGRVRLHDGKLLEVVSET